MSTVVTLGAATALAIGVCGGAWFGRLTVQIARGRVVVVQGHVYKVTAVDENGDPTLRRIR